MFATLEVLYQIFKRRRAGKQAGNNVLQGLPQHEGL